MKDMKLIRSSVLRMTGYVPGEQPESADVVKLNTNENPYPPSPMVRDALHGMDLDVLRRYPNPVCASLREKIALKHDCDVANVFVGNGSDEVLELCTQAFVENDGCIGYFEPSYSLYPVLAEMREVDSAPVALGSDFEWPDDFASCECGLFFIANPNAPTGILFPLERIRRFCGDQEGVVVIDEAYVDFASTDCMALAQECDNVLVTRTLSKSFSLAGLRVGYAVGSVALIDSLMKLKDSYNLDIISQTLALAALSDIEYMRDNTRKIQSTRTRLTKTLVSRGYNVYPSEANFVWVKPNGIAARTLFERLRDRKIFVRYFEGDVTGSYIRITVGTDEQIDRLLDTLEGIGG